MIYGTQYLYQVTGWRQLEQDIPECLGSQQQRGAAGHGEVQSAGRLHRPHHPRAQPAGGGGGGAGEARVCWVVVCQTGGVSIH